MLSFARSSRNANFVQTNFDSSICFCICLFHSFDLQECIRADFFVVEMNIHIQFPVSEIRFCGVIRNVLCSSLVLFFISLFQMLGTSVSEVDPALELQVFRKLLDLCLERSHDQHNLQVSLRGT